MSRTSANLLLLLTAAIWGSAFVVQKVGTESIGPMTFTGTRFLIGALVVLPFALRGFRQVRLGPAEWLGMAATGAALFAGAVLQQIGITMTTATNAGFLTALYVPLVPLISLVALRVAPHPVVWPAAAGSLLGTYLLSGGGAVALSAGDLWVLASSFFWALHVLLVGTVAARTGAPTVLAVVQFVVCGILSTVWGLAAEAPTWPELEGAAWAILYTGLFSVGLAFTFQVVGQRWTMPADAAIILSAEAVFASLAGMIFLGERLNTGEIMGCALILACILAVQLAPLRRESPETA